MSDSRGRDEVNELDAPDDCVGCASCAIPGLGRVAELCMRQASESEVVGVEEQLSRTLGRITALSRVPERSVELSEQALRKAEIGRASCRERVCLVV